MSKLPQIRRLVREDFPEVTWIDKLLFPINQFFQATYDALDKQLTLVENGICQANSFYFKRNAVTMPLSFTWNGKKYPTDLIVTKVVFDDGTAPTAAVFAHWNFDGTNVNITEFYGIDTAKQVTIRVLAIGN